MNAPVPSDLLQQASALIVRLNAVSVSLLQRHFRLPYSAAIALADALEEAGLVANPGIDGTRVLTDHARALHLAGSGADRQHAGAPSVRELFEAWAIDPFEGGDGGDAGSPHAPSIWMFGIEHGQDPEAQEDGASNDEPVATPAQHDYSIDDQMRHRYNRAAFQLLAAVHGEPLDQFEQFARRHQPFVPGAAGYLKGNLFPYPCRNVKEWTEQARRETGFESKNEMVAWCKGHRLPAIAQAVQRHRPRLFIGVGTKHRQDFAQAYFGADVPLQLYQFAINGFTKKVYYATLNDAHLVVLPHISSGANGLNSPAARQAAGSFIAGLMR